MLRIRLSRVGRKNQPFFKIVVVPKSAPHKGGKFRDEVGTHDPVNEETEIDAEKVRKWIAQGAQPSDTVHNLLISHGIISGKKKEVHDKEPTEPSKEEEQKESEEKKEEETKPEEDEGKKEEDEEEKKEEAEEETKSEEEEKEEEEKKEEKETKKETKGKAIEELDLTTRITNALEDSGIKNVEELKDKSEEELLDIKGLGEKSVEKILKELE